MGTEIKIDKLIFFIKQILYIQELFPNLKFFILYEKHEN